MTCREFTELLQEYVNGELPPEEDERVQIHLEACPPCVFLIETYRLTITISRKLPLVEMPADTAARLQAALSGQRAEQGQ
jgi:anti-sigma factor RsiW